MILRLSRFLAAAVCGFLIGAGTTATLADEPNPADNGLLRVPPTDPVRAAKTIQLQGGFRAELVAAEPLITDPIAMGYDENGLAYVVEMNDYPYSHKSHDQAWEDQTSEPIGRVRVLEDLDGDGTFDKSVVFADKLSWPSGVVFWKGGVYVAATPDVWYLKDTDGDRRADIRRRVFTGFRKYNVQAVMNNFQWGLDHRIYAAGSSNGGVVETMAPGADARTPVYFGRHDFRFDPGAEQFEAISGGARFGHTRDDWGNRFLCNIRNPDPTRRAAGSLSATQPVPSRRIVAQRCCEVWRCGRRLSRQSGRTVARHQRSASSR